MFSLVKIGNREMDAFVNSRILNILSNEPPVQRENKLKTFEPQTKKPKKSKLHVAEKHHKPLVKCLRKRIVNCVKKGEKITELSNSLNSRDYSGNPIKGSKHLITKLFQKRSPTSFSSTLSDDWKPEKVMSERMFMINTSPLPSQHKTFYDHGVFLVQKWLLFYISYPILRKYMFCLTIQGKWILVQEMWKGQGVMQLPDLHLTYL